MFNRNDAIDTIRNYFPDTEEKTQKDYINGGTHTYTVSPEWHLERMIDLHEPFYDGLKEGGKGLSPETAVHFQASVLHNYKNAHGLW